MRIILMFIFLGYACTLQAQNMEQLNDKVSDQMKKGQYMKAVGTFEKMIKLRPDSIGLQSRRAACLCYAYKRDESFAAFNEALQIAPENAQLFLQRGNCFHQYNMYDNAVQDFTEGLKYASVDSLKKALYLNRGASRISYRDIRGALEDNLMALKMDTLDAGTHNNLAMTYGDLFEFDKAEYHLRKVLELDSAFPGGLMNLGFMYSEMKEYDKALEILELAVASFPDQPYAINNRGFAKHMVGQSKEGIKDIEKSLKLDPSNSYAYRNLAVIYAALGQKDDACKSCIRAMELNFTTNYGDEMELFYKNNCTK